MMRKTLNKLNSYIRQISLLQQIIPLILLCIIIIFYYSHTIKYFNINIVINNIYFDIKNVILFTVAVFIILQYQYLRKKPQNPFVIFLFWFLILAISSLLYWSSALAFLNIPNAPDYIIKYKELFAIKMEYTLTYKCFFVKEYLPYIYEIASKQKPPIWSQTYNTQSFKDFLGYIDFSIVLEKLDTLSSIKDHCTLFVQNYIDYRIEQAYIIRCMHEKFLWEKSLLYHIGLFFKHSVILLSFPGIITVIIPAIINEIGFILLDKFAPPEYFLEKATTIIQKAWENYPRIYFYFIGTTLEEKDFMTLLGRLLLKSKGRHWVYYYDPFSFTE